MKRSTLELLCCPSCQTSLTLRNEQGDRIVTEGDLFCSHCERNYLLKNGMPHFINPQDLEGLNQHSIRVYKMYSRFARIIYEKLGFLLYGGERKARMEILQRLELNGGRILEVSIGQGTNLPYLFEAPKLGDVYGLDISEHQLIRCRKLVTKRGLPVDLFLGNAEVLPFKSESFDHVFHVSGICLFSEKKKAINEMIRVARPGSKIVIAEVSERVAQRSARLLRYSRSNQGRKVDTSIPVHLVPKTMEDIRVSGIWKSFGQYDAYCLEFRKPS